MKALITAATTAQAYKLQRLLNQEIQFIYADQVELQQFMVKEKQFVKIPAGKALSFAHELLTLCLDKQIDWVFPLRKNEIQALAEARQLFEEYGIRVLVPSVKKEKVLFSADAGNGTVFVVLDNTFIVKTDHPDINPEDFEDGIYRINPQNNTQYFIFTAD